MVAVLSFVACMLSIDFSIFLFTECWSTIFVVTGTTYDDDSNNDDGNYCRSREQSVAWGSVAIVEVVLFALVTVCTGYFVWARYDVVLAKWAHAQEQDETFVQAVEMVGPSTTPQATAIAISLPYDKNVSTV
jgi:hypothetical protein